MARKASLLIPALLFSLFVMTLAAGAQQGSRATRIGVFLFSSPALDPALGPFRAGLRDAGYVEGRDLVLEYHYAEGRPERLSMLAAQMARSKPDIIVAIGGDVALASKHATASIPIAALTSGDPVRGGLVATLNRPGGNLTGVNLLATDLAAKRLELLAEVAPHIRRVAFLWNPDHADDDFDETGLASHALRLEIIPLSVRRPEDIEPAFEVARRRGAEALIVVDSRLTVFNAAQISKLAAENRLPLIGGWGPWTALGGLLTYGPDFSETARRLASYVDRILKGAKPGDLPIEQPTQFELVINRRAARLSGLHIAPHLLARADKVIE